MSRRPGTRQVTLTPRDDRGLTGRDKEDLKITISDSGSDGATNNDSSGQADDHTVKPPTGQWKTVKGRRRKHKNIPQQQSHNRGGRNQCGFRSNRQQYLPPKYQNHHQQQKQQQHPPRDPQHQQQQQQQQHQYEPVHYDSTEVMGGCQSDRSKAHLKMPSPIKIKTYITNSGLSIICYTGDVIAAGAEGIVTAEGCGMVNPSMVTQSLLKMAGIDYGDLSSAVIHKFGTVDLQVGEVYCLQTLEYEIKLQFKSIFLAIVLPFKKAPNEYSWKSNTVTLYLKLLNEADKNGLKSLAIPLLGSGKIQF
ncbi:SUN domain-containing protein 2-like [Gigantopelta aegis]|uniref:SUN domain-containing protein 2-like n=1 Tax=Gigantopelta aegis TaxID=1735272 RepID=UPI001B88DA38|nr:SUN domain-containing protein 2-like [Gigantopelta aegis]